MGVFTWRDRINKMEELRTRINNVSKELYELRETLAGLEEYDLEYPRDNELLDCLDDMGERLYEWMNDIEDNKPEEYEVDYDGVCDERYPGEKEYIYMHTADKEKEGRKWLQTKDGKIKLRQFNEKCSEVITNVIIVDVKTEYLEEDCKVLITVTDLTNGEVKEWEFKAWVIARHIMEECVEEISFKYGMYILKNR